MELNIVFLRDDIQVSEKHFKNVGVYMSENC